MRELTPEPLTAEAFAPFGDVIEPSDRAEQLAINYGMTTRFNDLATLDIGEDHGRPIVSIFRGRLLAPLVLRIFENYARGTWHHFLLPLEAESDFLVIDRAGPGDNLDEIELGDETAIRVRD